MLGVNFALQLINTTAGKLAVCAVALVLWTAYQRHDATADCVDEQVRVELIAANAALRKSAEVARMAEEKAAEAETEMEKLKGEKDDLLKELAGSGVGCDLDPAVRERLLRIR